MYVCVYIHMYIYIYIYVCVFVCESLDVYMSGCICFLNISVNIGVTQGTFVAACCSVLQGISYLRQTAFAIQGASVALASPALCIALCSSVLQCVAVCCSVLQCVAMCCSVFPTRVRL